MGCLRRAAILLSGLILLFAAGYGGYAFGGYEGFGKAMGKAIARGRRAATARAMRTGMRSVARRGPVVDIL